MIVCAQDTAVVILSYNGWKWHEQFLPLIISEAVSGYDVIVADNASTDDNLQQVQQHFPSVKTLHIDINRGFANGYFEALKQVSAKYYILLSADFEVTAGWFSPLHLAMENTPGLGACQPKICYWRDREYFEYAGAGGGFMDKWGYLFCRGRIFDTLEKDEGQYDDNIEVFWASGGCLVVRADAYHAVGGLDAELYAHMEEIDLCWRLKNAGYRIGYVGGSTVYHVGGSVISYGSPQKLYYNYRNNLVLLLKNERAARLLWLLPWRLMLDGVSALQLLAGGQFKSVATIFRAHMHFYAKFGMWLRHRKAAQSIVKTYSRTAIYPHSIIWKYFAQRKKKFPELQ